MRAPAAYGAALAAVLVVAAALRFAGLDWDTGRYLHPDERFLAQVSSALAAPDSLRAYLDTPRAPLNPNNRGYGFYVYGTLPLFTALAAGHWFAGPGAPLAAALGLDLGPGYAQIHLVGRLLSALCDLLTTLLVAAIGTRLYGRATGLLAAAFYALAVLAIQQAHFFTVDAMATLMVTIALWFAARATTRARWSDDIGFGLALGAGLACKVSVFPAAVLLGIAVVLRLAVQGRALAATTGQDEAGRWRGGAALVVRAALSLNVVVLVGLLAFRLLQPYAFLPPYGGAAPASASRAAAETLLNVAAPRLNPAWLAQMATARRQQIGDDDSPPNHQWATRVPLAFPWYHLVAWGLGWPLGLVAWAGWAAALGEGLRGRGQSWRHVLPVSWVGLYFAWFGAGWVATLRYFLPLCPVLAITAAWVLLRVAAPQHDRSAPGAAAPPRWRRALGVAAIAVTLGATALWAAAFSAVYRAPHTRVAASRWLYDHAPAAATLQLATADGRRAGLGLALSPSTPPADADSDAPVAPAALAGPDAPATARVRVDEDSTLVGLRLHAVDGLGVAPPALALGATIVTAEAADVPLAHCTLAFSPGQGESRDEAIATAAASAGAECSFAPLPLRAGQQYVLRLAASAPVAIRGAVIANEGNWDDAVPMPLPGLDVHGRFATWGLEMAWEDDAKKRRRLQRVLDGSDYVVISSNRFTGSLSRNPRRWPMTLDYYRALFSGALGFALVADFTSPPTLAGFVRDDQEAEEAFTVYDHPRVMVFRKTAAYDPVATATVLGRTDLRTVVRKRADQVTESAVRLPLPPAGPSAAQ